MKTMAIMMFMSLFVITTLFALDLESDLVLYYTFDDITDTTVPDGSPYGINGTIVGPSFSITDGWIGNGLDLNPNEGDTAYVNAGDSAIYDITEQITLSVWVNQRDCGNGEHNPWVGKGDHAYAIKLRPVGDDPENMGNDFEFFIYSSGGWYSVKSPADEAYNEFWHHFVGTFDGSLLVMYIDGELVGTTERIGTINTVVDAVNVGRNSQKPTRFYNGLIDEVRIYSRALTSEDVMELYNLPTHMHAFNNFPEDFVLDQNYPNPFNPTTQISYTIPKTGFVTLKVFDIHGRKIETLVSQFQNPGMYAIPFNAMNLSSGVYFYQLQLGKTYLETKKMLLVR